MHCQGKAWGQEPLSHLSREQRYHLPACLSVERAQRPAQSLPGSTAAGLALAEDALPASHHLISQLSSADRWEHQPSHSPRSIALAPLSCALPMVQGCSHPQPQPSALTAGHGGGGRDRRTPPAEPLRARPAAGPQQSRGHQLQSWLQPQSGAGSTKVLLVLAQSSIAKGFSPEPGRKGVGVQGWTPSALGSHHLPQPFALPIT